MVSCRRLLGNTSLRQWTLRCRRWPPAACSCPAGALRGQHQRLHPHAHRPRSSLRPAPAMVGEWSTLFVRRGSSVVCAAMSAPQGPKGALLFSLSVYTQLVFASV